MWLFAGNESGARNAPIQLGFIVSWKLPGVDPSAWLKDVLVPIPTHPADRIGELIQREWKNRFGHRDSYAAPAAA